MKCYDDIKKLASERFKDAECLQTNQRFEAAYYLAGYAVELLLKARVCKTLGIEDFFDFDNPLKKKIKNDGNLYRPFRVHDLEQLLVLSGIYTEFENKIASDNNFKAAWSIIEKWNENSRYLTERTETDVKDLLTSIKKFEGWILNYL